MLNFSLSLILIKNLPNTNIAIIKQNPNNPVLIPELTSLEERKEGNSIAVEAPQRIGFHDDISDAFSRAVWAAYNSKKGNVKRVTLGLAGGSGGGSGSYKAFHFNKLKIHGESPRDCLGIVKGRNW